MPAVAASRPPPVGGWDARNALADMPEENAVILDNWFPSTDKVTLRKGFTSHATGLSGNVESLLEYAGVDGTNKLFAANSGSLYDVSSTGAVGAAVATGFTNNRFQQVQIGTAGGQFLLAMNGDDTPKTYNGTSWADSTITGPTITNLIWCNLHQRRLWFGEKNSLSAWYLAVNSITGAATEFPLAGLASKGGYIMAMGTWTRDGGDGQDDVAVFLTSEGEAIIYSGTDPSSSSSWSLVGVFQIGRPIGRRCMIKAGADLIMVTQDGFVAASSILSIDRARAQKVALSAQINKAVNDDVRDHKDLFGWQPVIYARGAMMIFNVPQSSTQFYQYVFNTLTGAPCRFTGINALCWGSLGDNLYFGGTDGNVYQFDSGNSDNGTAIAGDALQSFSDFGTPESKKLFKMVEPIFTSGGDPNPALDMNTDFQIGTPTGASQSSVVSSARWGVGKWGVGQWGTNGQVYRGWKGIRGRGRSGALRVRVTTTTTQPSWVSTNYLFVPGVGL